MTPRQARFVEEFLKHPCAAAAARAAGYAHSGAAEEGYRLLRKAEIKEAVERGQSERSERLRIDADSVLRQLVAVAAEAREAGKFSAAVQALGLIGKHLGMFERRPDTAAIDVHAEERAIAAEVLRVSPDAVNHALKLLEYRAAQAEAAMAAT